MRNIISVQVEHFLKNSHINYQIYQAEIKRTDDDK